MIRKLKCYTWSKMVRANDTTWDLLKPLLAQVINTQTLEMLCMERYAHTFLSDFDTAWAHVVKNKKCMLIEKGDFAYSYFNVAYVNNVLSLIFYAMYQGYVPVICINHDLPDNNQWDWYFKQPHVIMNTDITGFDSIVCDIPNHDLRPDMQMIHTSENWKYKLYRLLAQKFLHLNENTQAYVDSEIKAIGEPSSMLGVLIRGTDYIKLRPSGHPVQPEPQEIVACAARRFNEHSFSAVYVATEEKQLYDMVSRAVGSANVRENKRQYYDDLYYQSNDVLIGRVKFDRENDNYLKGLEYLSSLTILSKCKSLVAGNCGGTLYAMLLGDYNNPYIFNYGVYS